MDALAIIRARKAAAPPDALAIVRARNKKAAEESKILTDAQDARIIQEENYKESLGKNPVTLEWGAQREGFIGGVSQIAGDLNDYVNIDLGLDYVKNQFNASGDPIDALTRFNKGGESAQEVLSFYGLPENSTLADLKDTIAKSLSRAKDYVPPARGNDGMHSLARAYNEDKATRRGLADEFGAEHGQLLENAKFGISDLANPLAASQKLLASYAPRLPYIAEKTAQSAPLTLAALGTGVVAGPTAAGAVVAAGMGPDEYLERRQRGESVPRAAGGALQRMALEGAGEVISAGALGTLSRAGSIVGRTAASRAGRAGVATAGEVFGEEITEVGNIGTDILYDGKIVTVDAGLRRLIDTGAIAIAMSVGASAPIAYAISPGATPEQIAKTKADAIAAAKTTVEPIIASAASAQPKIYRTQEEKELAEADELDINGIPTPDAPVSNEANKAASISALAATIAKANSARSKADKLKLAAQEAAKVAEISGIPLARQNAETALNAAASAEQAASAFEQSAIDAKEQHGDVDEYYLDGVVAKAQTELATNERLQNAADVLKRKSDAVDAANAKVQTAKTVREERDAKRAQKLADQEQAEAKAEIDKINSEAALAAKNQDRIENKPLYDAKKAVFYANKNVASIASELDIANRLLSNGANAIKTPELEAEARARAESLTKRLTAAQTREQLAKSALESIVNPSGPIPNAPVSDMPVEAASIVTPELAVKDKPRKATKLEDAYLSDAGQYTPEEFVSAKLEVSDANTHLARMQKSAAMAKGTGEAAQQRLVKLQKAQERVRIANKNLDSMKNSVRGDLSGANIKGIQASQLEAKLNAAAAIVDPIIEVAPEEIIQPEIISPETPVAVTHPSIANAEKKLVTAKRRLAEATSASEISTQKALQDPSLKAFADSEITSVESKQAAVIKAEQMLSDANKVHGTASIAPKQKLRVKLKPIAPETAYEAAQTTTIEPVKIKSAEEIDAAPVDEVDDFKFDPYFQDNEVQSTVKLGNKGGEIGHESEADYKGPRPQKPRWIGNDSFLTPRQNQENRNAYESGGSPVFTQPTIEGAQMIAGKAKAEASQALAAANTAKDNSGMGIPQERLARGLAVEAIRKADIARDAEANLASFGKPKLKLSKVAPTYLEALTELGKRDGAFNTSIPVGDNVIEMANSVFPGVETYTINPEPGEVATGIIMPGTSKTVFISETAHKVWVDVSELLPGQDGSNIYRIASARAKAVGKRFIPDPTSITPVAEARRPEMMLTEGIKHGDFSFLEPGDQVQNYAGDSEQKATALAEQNIKTVVAAYPEMADIVTDGEQFVNAVTGEVFTDEQFNKIAGREPSKNVPEGYRAGIRTLKRTAFLNTFSPGRRESFGVAALAKLSQRSGNDLPIALQKFLYSKAGNSQSSAPSGIDAGKAKSAVDGAFGAGTFDRAIKSGKVKLYNSPDEVGADSNASAAFDEENDQIMLFANNLSPDNVAGKFLHEYAHRGFEDAVGGQAEAKKIYDELAALLKKNDPDVVKATEWAAGESDVPRETLAYLLEQAENGKKQLPETLFEAISRGIRKGLSKVGIKLGQGNPAAFKRRVINIARASLKAQVAADTRKAARAEKAANAKRDEATKALNEPKQDIDLSDLDKRTSAFNKFIGIKLFDKNYSVELMQEYFKQLGGKIVDSIDIAQRLNAFSSSLASAIKQVVGKRDKYTAFLRDNNISLRDSGRWMAYNYRDAYNAKFPDANNASGISDQEVADGLAELAPRAEVLQKAADMVTAMYKEAALVKFRGNLITKEEYDARDPNYVAFRGSDVDAMNDTSDVSVPGLIGKNITGKEYKDEGVRTGPIRYEDIGAHAVHDLMQSNARAAWNRVVRTVMAFAAANPNNGLIKLEPVKDHTSVLSDKALVGKINGKPYKVVFTHPGIAKAILSAGGVDQALVRLIGTPNRLFARALTTSFTFTTKQIVMDNIEGYARAASEQGAKVANGMAANEFKAGGALYRWANDKPNYDLKEDQQLRDYLRFGGMTSRYGPENFQKVTREMRRKLQKVGVFQTPANVAKAAGNLASASVNAFKKEGDKQSFGDAFNDFSDSLGEFGDASKLAKLASTLETATNIAENMPRFAFFMSMQQNKPEISAERAAYLAKELTVNFDRKGEWSNLIGSMILFFGPIAQSARVSKKLFLNKKFMAGFGVAVGVTFAIGMSNADWKDEEGKPAIQNVPAYERETKLVALYGGGKGQYFTIPLPPGLISIANLWGQSAATARKLKEIGDEQGLRKLGWETLKGTLSAIGPSPNEDGSISFGYWDKIKQVWTNEKPSGAPVRPKGYNDNTTPLAEQTYGNNKAPWFSQAAADALGYVGTLGQGGKPNPMFDWSPDQIEHLLGPMVNGYMKELNDLESYRSRWYQRSEAAGSQYAANKAASEFAELPIVKNFLGKQYGSDMRVGDQYSDRNKKVELDRIKYDDIKTNEGVDAAEAYRSESAVSSGGRLTGRRITTDGDDMRGRSKRAGRELSDLNKLIHQWYNAQELNDGLFDSFPDEVDISDMPGISDYSNKIRPYKTVVIERLKERMSQIKRESLKE